jgi:hypothetical protein
VTALTQVAMITITSMVAEKSILLIQLANVAFGHARPDIINAFNHYPTHAEYVSERQRACQFRLALYHQ